MASEFLQYPFNLGRPPFDKWIKFSAMTGRHVLRSKPSPEQQPPDRAVGSVGLYLPTGALKSTLDILYDKTAFGPFMGAAIESLVQGGKNVMGSKGGGSGLTGIQEMLSSVSKNVTDIFSKGDYKGLVEASSLELIQSVINGSPKLAPFLQGLNVQDAAAVAFGIKTNPRTEMLFSTQNYREHTLDFMLIPRSVDEAKAIDRIVYFFQFYSLPRYSGTNDNPINSFMIGFPYEFTVDMLAAQPNNSNIVLEHINKIGRSTLISVDVDHAAGGKTAFIKDDGEFYPVATALRLHFREVRLVARGDDEIKRFDSTVVGPQLPGTGDLDDPLQP